MAHPKMTEELYVRRARAMRAFVESHTTEKGYPPSMREIGEHLGVVPSTVHLLVRRMVDEGLLIAPPGVGRQIRVTETVLPEIGEVL